MAQVEGCYYNVVGLPLCEERTALLGAGVKVEPYPAGGYCAYCPVRLIDKKRESFISQQAASSCQADTAGTLLQ